MSIEKMSCDSSSFDENEYSSRYSCKKGKICSYKKNKEDFYA